jgi:hypothetical protein
MKIYISFAKLFNRYVQEYFIFPQFCHSKFVNVEILTSTQFVPHFY